MTKADGENDTIGIPAHETIAVIGKETMIRNQSNSEVRAVAAAAITITYRGTYMYHTHTSYAGDKGVPETKVCETKNCLVDFSKFTIFQLLGMVRWKNAHFEKQKHGRKKKHAFRSSRQQQSGTSALELDDSVLIGENGSIKHLFSYDCFEKYSFGL